MTDHTPISDADLERVRLWVCDDTCTEPHLPIQALQAVIARLDDVEKELADRRIAMHQIYWLNVAPNVDSICRAVYLKWGGVPTATET